VAVGIEEPVCREVSSRTEQAVRIAQGPVYGRERIFRPDAS
jgi:hypothetical protein